MFNGTLHVLENVETNVDIVSRLNELGRVITGNIIFVDNIYDK
jgi:hypothetical protein